MTTDTKLNQLIINKLTQEQYDEAQVKSNLSQITGDSTTKHPSNKAVSTLADIL